jgi:tRNA1Val (adenine37-N6)-methyltransferase
MSESQPFRLKQFSLYHHRASMKVSTDSILLGSICNPQSAKSVLDIGTGCGILALMMAQKTNAVITAIDIDKPSIDEATQNFSESPWSHRLNAMCWDVEDFAKDPSPKFDLIIANPPYFSEKVFSSDAQRHQARNTDSLSFEKMLDAVDNLLNTNGDFWLILPPLAYKDFAVKATAHLFSSPLSVNISHVSGQPTVLVVSHWRRFDQECVHQVKSLAMYDEKRKYTEAFKTITADFYHNF